MSSLNFNYDLGSLMTSLTFWKHLTKQANSAFEREHYPLAETLYRQSIELMKIALAEKPEKRKTEDPAMMQIICLSVSIQNLADLYARQGRWQRCFTTLESYLSLYERAAADTLRPPHVSLTFMQEGCRFRRELLRHRASCKCPHSIDTHTSAAVSPMPELVH